MHAYLVSLWDISTCLILTDSQFGYSAHWVTAEVHLREPSRRYDKKVRSFSPPPGYDTDPGCSTWRSSTAQFVDEASV
nr:unnamed protein product [Haemonchus contortus]